jgi:hypothetical protein
MCCILGAVITNSSPFILIFQTQEYGLQPSCSINDEGVFNICLDLTSTSGVYEEDWMNDVKIQAAQWERVITGDLPPITSADIGRPPNPPNPPDLSQVCTAYPDVIDDLYICAQDVDIPPTIFPDGSISITLAFAGPYLCREIGTINPVNGLPFVLPYGGRIGVNNFAIDDPLFSDGIPRAIFHEFCHALGL